MEGYLLQIRPQVGDTWRTDELFLKVKGNMKYLFAMMDDGTRFRIAQMASTYKGTADVQPMFREAMATAGKKPKVLISDGAPNFHRAYNKEMWTHFNPRPVHIQEIRMSGKVRNNKMERQNGEWRDREKVMRGLKREDSPVLGGMQVFHNSFRPHEGLGGKTPAEAAGIKRGAESHADGDSERRAVREEGLGRNTILSSGLLSVFYHPPIPRRRFLRLVAVWMMGFLVGFLLLITTANVNLLYAVMAWALGGAVVLMWYWYLAGRRDVLKSDEPSQTADG